MGPTNIVVAASAWWKLVELSSSISTTLGEAFFAEGEHPSDLKRVVCRDRTAVTRTLRQVVGRSIFPPKQYPTAPPLT